MENLLSIIKMRLYEGGDKAGLGEANKTSVSEIEPGNVKEIGSIIIYWLLRRRVSIYNC